jgi:hypothetical protein
MQPTGTSMTRPSYSNRRTASIGRSFRSSNEGERNDETEIIFLPDGRLLATTRLEYDESRLDGALGDKRGATLITTTEPPFAVN